MLQINASAQAVTDASAILEQGGIVILPTHRWYMVCTLADNTTAINEIFSAKKRSLSKQPLFVIPNKKLTETFFAVGHASKKLIDRLWPGDLSLLLSWSSPEVGLPYPAIGGSHALVNNPSGLFGQISERVQKPLAATTVNVSETLEADKYGPAITASEAHQFIVSSGLKVGLLIDGGISPAFNHTTILDCRNHEAMPTMVREGYVHRRALNIALEQSVF